MNLPQDLAQPAPKRISLNPEQEQAVEHVNGPCFVCACPGSGKTRVIVERTIRLIEKGTSPRSILCITFTNKAANEMKERIVKKLGNTANEIYISTFHSLCATIIRKFGDYIGYGVNTTILDDDDQEGLMSQSARQAGLELTSPYIKSLIWKANDLREKLIPESEFKDNFKDEKEANIVLDYLARMRKNNQIDFSGLLSETVRLLEKDAEILCKLQTRFDYIQVDEAQDTNLAQFRLVQLLGAHNNVFVVGDPDQCQPEGTMVETTNGIKRIEDLDETKDKLVSFSRRNSMVIGRRNGLGFKKSRRPYAGDLIKVKMYDSVLQTECTPNHKWTVRFSCHEHAQAVYLMRQGDRWRVGHCSMNRSGGKKYDTDFGPSLRARNEKADAFWILTICTGSSEAQAVEQIVSCRYGIPVTCFEDHHHKPSYIEYVFKTLGNLDKNALKCLQDYGRDINFPIWEKREKINQDFGKRIPLLVHACNLIPEIMQIPVPIDGKKFEWRDFELSRSHYKGWVYSLDVERHGHYIADGIITHNSVYGWRGARYQNIEDFIKINKAKVVSLPQNYRSTPEIVKIASNLIKKNPNRQQQMEFKTSNPSGKPVECLCLPNPEQEASYIANRIREMIISKECKPHEIAILYRINSMSRSLEQGLMNAGIPYQVIGGFSFFDRAEVKDCMAMLRFAINPMDGMALSRFINKPTRKIGEVTLGKIENFANDNGINLIEALKRAEEYISGRDKAAIIKGCKEIVDAFDFDRSNRSIGETLAELLSRMSYGKYLDSHYESKDLDDRKDNIQELVNACALYSEKRGNDIAAYLSNIALQSSSDKESKENSVSLMSLHASKGLEFPVVFMPCMEEGQFPHKRAIVERDGLDEERRLCYVGMTRAERQLILTFPAHRMMRYKNGGVKFERTTCSRFLAESGASVGAQLIGARQS